MYNISIPVTAKIIEPDKRIVIEWPGYSGPTGVQWTFARQEDDTTFVSITEAGFIGDGDELVKQVTDSTQGFTLVLAASKRSLSTTSDLTLWRIVILKESKNTNLWNPEFVSEH